jgi:F-type H+-transporting ATPase subunit delta
MLTGGAAKRYAEAIFEIARDAGSFEVWGRDLALMSRVVTDVAGRQFFANPKTDQAQKWLAAERILTNRVQPAALNLARLLITRDRFHQVDRIEAVFAELVREHQSVAIAEVTTAIPLDQAAAAAIARQLGAIIGKRIELRAHVDDSIIGGVVARVGDYLIDGSVTGQLRRLRTRLAERR